MDKLYARVVSIFLFLLVLVFFGFQKQSLAARMDYSYGSDGEYSDNATLVRDNKVSELRLSPIIGGALNETTSRFEADLSAMIEFHDYRDNTFRDEAWGYLSSDLNWIIRPATFFWVLEDYFSQVERDPLLSSTPANIIDTNVFSTGPDLFFRINPSKRVGVKARFSDYRFDDTLADSQRKSIKLSLLSKFSSSTEWSLNSEYQKAEFTEVEGSDFNRFDLFFSIDYMPSRSSFHADLGISNIQSQIGNEIDGYLTRLSWRNQFRRESYFQLNVSSQYTDSALDLMAARSFEQGLDLSAQQISGDVFYDSFIELIYHLTVKQSSYEIQVIFRNEDYEVLPLDSDTNGLRLNYNYIFSQQFQLTSSVQHQEYDYLDITQRDKEIAGNLAIIYRLSSNYTFSIAYNHIKRDSTNSALNYDENTLLISFYYGRHPGSYR